ncbi:ATP-binding protein [Methylomonas sp. BW4-1]|uniref:ATP-binding protein n=1 Tax=Methylomonas sp. BW4-1 TaxID=3376685 RepID=UPI004042093E
MAEQEKQSKYTRELDDFISFAFDDLVEIAKTDFKLFEELYYNRKNQCDEFYALMEDKHKKAQNVLVIGNAGVGKTSFMHKLIINCNNAKFYPVLMDYRKIVPKSTHGLVSDFLRAIESYFDDIGSPIHTLKSGGSMDQNFQEAYNHLESLDLNSLKKQLIIFLDDFDYAEEEWFDLLRYFLPFSNNNKVSLVLSVRPLLLSAIDEYDDRFRNSYIRKARQIELAPISVENVISTRLAPVLAEREKTGLISKIFKRESSLCKLAKKYGKIVDDLPRFEYPLTIKHNDFMQRITSGDLRETFAIAYESLKFVLEHEDYLENKVEDDGSVKKIIGRENVMKILYDNKDAHYSIINLHTFRSKSTKNSLFYNVLQGIKIYGVADDRFFEVLKDLGHEKKKVDEAIDELSSKKQRFFVPIKYVAKSAKKRIEYAREYKALPKLDKYLEMCEWDEYIQRCGEPGASLEDML